MSDSRLEKFIYAICSMDVSDLPVPLSRIEKLWNCLITGETPDFEPLSRNEKYLMAMLDRYDISNLPAPMSRGEKLLYKIAVGETDLSDVPGYLSRYEELLKYLIENGGISGGDFEYVLYTLNQSLYTLYTTAEKPVKSAILKGNTKYRDIDTGDILDTFDETKNLELVSVRMPVLTTTGKNLFDISKEQKNITINLGNGDVDIKTNDRNTSDFIKVIPNTIYKCNVTMTRLAYYDKNKQFISSNSSVSQPITIPTSCNFVKFSYDNALTNIQFEQGSIATSYEPYKANILTVNEDVTLRSKGGVYDELNLLNGRLTQRIDENNEVLAQEVVKTVDLTVVDQDSNATSLSTFDDTTHVLLESEGLIPTASLTVRTKIPTASSTSLLMDDISTKQEQLNTTVDEQSDNVDATMIAVTEIYEETL